VHNHCLISFANFCKSSLLALFSNDWRWALKLLESIVTLIQKDLLDQNISDTDIYILGSAQVAPHAKIANNKNKLIEKINHPARGWIAAGLLRVKGVDNVQYLFTTEFTSLQSEYKKDLCDYEPQEVANNPSMPG
jgi:hypothetical protein